MEIKYQIVIEPGEDGWFVVTVPALPGCITQGKTKKRSRRKCKRSDRSIS
jgi:antitoxin HicB